MPPNDIHSRYNRPNDRDGQTGNHAAIRAGVCDVIWRYDERKLARPLASDCLLNVAFDGVSGQRFRVAHKMMHRKWQRLCGVRGSGAVSFDLCACNIYDTFYIRFQHKSADPIKIRLREINRMQLSD